MVFLTDGLGGIASVSRSAGDCSREGTQSHWVPNAVTWYSLSLKDQYSCVIFWPWEQTALFLQSKQFTMELLSTSCDAQMLDFSIIYHFLFNGNSPR